MEIMEIQILKDPKSRIIEGFKTPVNHEGVFDLRDRTRWSPFYGDNEEAGGKEERDEYNSFQVPQVAI